MLDYNQLQAMCPNCSVKLDEIDEDEFEPFFQCPECGEQFFYNEVYYAPLDEDGT